MTEKSLSNCRNLLAFFHNALVWKLQNSADIPNTYRRHFWPSGGSVDR